LRVHERKSCKYSANKRRVRREKFSSYDDPTVTEEESFPSALKTKRKEGREGSKKEDAEQGVIRRKTCPNLGSRMAVREGKNGERAKTNSGRIP